MNFVAKKDKVANILCHFPDEHIQWHWFIQNTLSEEKRIEVPFLDVVSNNGTNSYNMVARALPVPYQHIIPLKYIPSIKASSVDTATSKQLTSLTDPLLTSLTATATNTNGTPQTLEVAIVLLLSIQLSSLTSLLNLPDVSPCFLHFDEFYNNDG